MNFELLLKLAKQAEVYVDGLPEAHYEVKIWKNAFRQKYAELIVQECCKIVNDRTQSVNNPHDSLTVLDIKEHFGMN